ncbi:MAG: hypothetical protein M1830_010456 [Pleopsidium flavum]|nr:MAG: hypothetical protein M1830_010456 [Pleopsidium flavum]
MVGTIHTLLQPSIVRTGLLPHTSAATSSTYKPPSTKDIPPVTLTNIPHVDSAAFKPYLTQVGSLYDAFQRAKEGNDDNGSQPVRHRQESSKSEELDDILNRGLQRQPSAVAPAPQYGSSLSSPIGSPLQSPQSKRRTSGNVGRRVHPVTPLSTIPQVYFDQAFHLENPRTFDIVSERSEVVRPVSGVTGLDGKGTNGSVTAPGPTGRKALATNAILQEKLSWYMDTVEVHLISSISTASTSFFAALGSLRELHSEAADSVTRIKKLREGLATLDQAVALGGLKIVSMRCRRENIRKLGDAVKQLREIVNGVAHCEEQINNGEVETALKELDDVERLMAGECSIAALAEDKSDPLAGQGKLQDFRGLKALEGATDELSLLRHRIGKAYEFRFLEALLGDLRGHVDSVSPQITLQRWGTASQRSRGEHSRGPSALPAYLNLEDKLRFSLRSNLEGLTRSEHVMPAATAYRESVVREIKSLIRRHLPSSNEDDNESMLSASTHGGRQMSQQEKSLILARNLRALDAGDAEEMFMKIYAAVGEALRRLGVQLKVLLDITSGISNTPATAGLRSPPKSPNNPTLGNYLDPKMFNPTSLTNMQEEMHQALDMSSLLGQAVDIAQTQITKILKVRSDQSIRLPLRRFLRYFTVNRLFADECEAVSGRGGTALKSVVNGHIKDFVIQFGDLERQRIVAKMDVDRWDAKDFGNADSSVLSRILEGSTRDPEPWTRDFRIWEKENDDVDSTPAANGTVMNGAAASVPGKDKVHSATVDEQKYILPQSAMSVLKGVDSFEHLMTGIPSMTQEVALNLLEYLKLFNSRSAQLILGAGATRSAGLKNITTKHLALASQALSFVIALIPYIRESVRRHSSASGALMSEFDRVKRLYQDHQAGIHDKLVDIMSGRAAMHVNAMRKIDWDDSSGKQGVSPYMETLTKETITLHKVLSKHLPEVNVTMIMDPVFSSYKEQWSTALREVVVKTESGKERLLHDVDYLKSRLCNVSGARDIGDYLLDIIKEKVVASKADATAVEPPPADTKPSI